MESWLTPIIEAGVAVFAVTLFLTLSLAYEGGYRLGRWRRGSAVPTETRIAAVSVLTGGMVTLLAFMLGLAVDFAQNRFEARREHVAVEANAIDTAWRRAHLLAPPEGEALEALIAEYGQSRLAFTVADIHVSVPALLARTADLETRIWAVASTAATRAPNPITAAAITALNPMFDAAVSQRFSFEGRIPRGVLSLLVVGSVLAIGALGVQLGLAGHRQPVLSSLLILMWVGPAALTVDLNRPRLGALRVDPSPLVWVLRGMRADAPSP